MIITQTPVRISFFGGGTDYPQYFMQNEGETLVEAINKFSYLSVNSMSGLFDHRIRVSYTRTELTSTVDQIEHPSVRACLKFLGIEGGIEIHYAGDLPARTGLGSSSSFTVGLLNALHALKGERVSPLQLANEAVYVERDLLGELVGVQDQYACAIGGFLHLRITRSGIVTPSLVPISPDRLGALTDRLLLIYTGICRGAQDVLPEQLTRTEGGLNDEALEALRGLVPVAIEVLCGSCPLDDFGRLLGEAWMYKRRLSSSVSSTAIDEMYDRAVNAGALGGKLLGAGGGGFLLFYVSPDRRRHVIGALSDLKEVSFSFYPFGTSIVANLSHNP